MKPAEILRELKKYPKKLLGQHFLVDSSAVAEMVEAAELSGEETVVEIGPGLGAITLALLEHAKQVIAIELDYEFANYLRLKKQRRLVVVRGDALAVDWTETIDGPYKIVANIPYSITSPLLRKIYSLDYRPETAVLLVQKELAHRLVAKPGDRQRGLLTLMIEANTDAKIVRTVKPGSFYPRPKTDSAVVQLITHHQSLTPTIYWPALQAGFRHKRQLLVNALSKDLKRSKAELLGLLQKCSIKPSTRAQELDFAAWQCLSQKLM